MGFFPEDFYNTKTNIKKKKEIPLLKDYAINLDTGEILLDKNKNAIIVEGLDAVIVQAWRKIHTKKIDPLAGEGYLIYGKNFGSKLHKLIGKSKSNGDIYAYQMLHDCLVDGTYVTGISNFLTELEKSCYKINYTIESIYGNKDDSFYVDID
ncbi:DUF2634 domain-containing protein [Clostridium botulinum]|uniref:DUF2634 domain-containing protein n=1 Tax=Clostridium botulinum (strain Eklund 17B / Type B) TaxID=935198 RepID=B2TMU5_CLOBB|nr:conserved hypothetical protein [Clostridium botulinum B str. Eklund 17B (NRP)]MBY6977143.1 DUF2634 domain-containing protein [Clostridium botulinum]MBY6999300.1 DUF2634 domain-containing protein [Clostridium botulinum]MCR1272617.1 DUF2634 domain-containing protein [Clostridium botulinum]NFD70007.1 DUF2634 domain-containing protein [Clostridium botulinum]